MNEKLLGNWNAEGDWDDAAPAFSEDEIARAREWRQKYSKMTPQRRDYCPHPTPCESVDECIERMAWYFRHRTFIEHGNK